MRERERACARAVKSQSTREKGVREREREGEREIER